MENEENVEVKQEDEKEQVDQDLITEAKAIVHSEPVCYNQW